MRLLLLDILHRRKLVLVYATMYFIAAASTSSFIYSSSFGMGMGFGAMLGIVFATRELHYLPISRKEIWRARWILALTPVILAAMFRILIFAIGMAIAQVLQKTTVPLSWVPPSVAFQLVFLGSLLAASIPVSYITGKFASPARRVLANAALVLTAVILGALFEQKLPTQWQDLTSGTSLILAFGLCLSVVGFFHSPKIVPREFFAKRLEPSSRAIKPDLKARSLWAGRTGLNLLVWRQVLAFLITGVVCGIGAQLPLLVLGWQPADRASLIERGGTLFASTDPRLTVADFLAAAYFPMPVMLSAIWTTLAPDTLRVRHLRVLPMTTRTLAAMFTFLPTLTWLTFWLFLLAGYWLLAGHLPSTFRLDLLAGIAGLTCLLNSASMQARVISRGNFFFLDLLACGGFLFLYLYLQPLSPAVTSLVGGFGLIGVAVSFLLNVRALQQNSSVYVSLIRIHTVYPQRFLAQ